MKTKHLVIGVVLGVVGLLCGYAVAQMGAAVFLGVQTSASACTWSNAAVVSNGLALCPLNVGTAAAPVPGVAIALNQGPFVQMFPAPPVAAGVASFAGRTGSVLPASGDYSLSQLSGQITASQLPATTTCSVSATIGTANKITITACQ